MNSIKDIQLVEMISQIQIHQQLRLICKDLEKSLIEKADLHPIERLGIIEQIIHINQLTEVLLEVAWNNPVWKKMVDDSY